MKNVILSSVIVLFLGWSCEPVKKANIKLTDENVSNYIGAYKELREKVPSLLEEINKTNDKENFPTEFYDEFKAIIKKHGIDSYADFVMLNAKIGAIFSIIQGEAGMGKLKSQNGKGLQMIEDGINLIKEELKNSNLTDEAREQLKSQLKELKAQKKQLQENWSKNEKWAMWTLEKVKKVSNVLVDSTDIEVIKRHEKEIMEAYAGYAIPSNFNVK